MDDDGSDGSDLRRLLLVNVGSFYQVYVASERQKIDVEGDAPILVPFSYYIKSTTVFIRRLIFWRWYFHFVFDAFT